MPNCKTAKFKRLKLKDLIEIADGAYPEGLVAQYSRNSRANLGDDLAKFVAEELDSTFDPLVPEAEQLCQAARSMEKAASELAKVAKAFRAKLHEPLEKLEAARRKAADEAWESAKLPNIEASDGWTIDGVFWSRKVFWSNPGAESTCGSIVGSFGVAFEADSAKIIDQWHQ